MVICFPRSLIAVALIGFSIGGMPDAIAQPAPQHTEQSGAAPNEEAKRGKVAKPLGETLALILDKTWDDPVAFFTFRPRRRSE
jgi:hypothetical protein